MNDNNTRIIIPGDNPINSKFEDKLGRAIPAKSFAKHVLKLDVSNGAVVGVFAPWGSGKSSFIKLACEEFEDAGIPIFEFNPWMFSGAEQLVLRFFEELSATMSKHKKLNKIKKALRKYGKVLSVTMNASVGIVTTLENFPWFGLNVPFLTKIGVRWSIEPKCANSMREKAEEALKERNEPIIVVLDDIDRLTATEIREVFKLVRLTASFPNLIYIVLCDRHRIEYALAEPELSGRDYQSVLTFHNLRLMIQVL